MCVCGGGGGGGGRWGYLFSLKTLLLFFFIDLSGNRTNLYFEWSRSPFNNRNADALDNDFEFFKLIFYPIVTSTIH